MISGGELAAAIVVDAVTRLQPGALGCEIGAFEDSFATGLLEYPQYTRPAAFRGEGVPEILTSGDHAKVARWRREQALLRTWQRRPDLLDSAPLSDADRAFLARLEAEAAAQASHEAGAGDQLGPPSGVILALRRTTPRILSGRSDVLESCFVTYAADGFPLSMSRPGRR